MFLIGIKFCLCVFFVVGAGYFLSISADKIAEIKGLSKAWIGIVLLASVTSLPELSTTLAAKGSPDLAVGNIFGSNSINMVIIAIVDFLNRGAPILGVVSIGHILNAGFGLFITGVSMFAILLRVNFKESATIGAMGIESIIIMAAYLVGMKLLYTYERKDGTEGECADMNEGAPQPVNSDSLSRECLIALTSSVVVVISGIWLAELGDEIAEVTGWGTTFVGTIFLAFATSLPEIVVSISAITLKSFDMCVGNMFGSNFFNIFIIAVLDMATSGYPILSRVSADHILTAVLGIILTTLIIIGIIFREKKRFKSINYEIWLVVICYLIGSYFLFTITVK